MPGEYDKAITIKEAIEAINSRDFLLPAIQRKFVWNTNQICVLFDSILRSYPINTFMMWEVKKDEIKRDYKFYGFLDSYCQRFNEENPLIKTTASFKNFKAIIDGQQRLTSLYIGLCSTYAYKQPRVWWPNSQDDSVLPPRKLYIDLKQPTKTDDDDALMFYDLRFLTDEQFGNSTNDVNLSHNWYCMHEILNLPHCETADKVLLEVVIPELEKRGLSQNKFALKTLLKLYSVVRIEKIIHYFKEMSQKIDHVLDVFIRTNGGTKLAFADLLMSIAVANWDGDFRQELDGLIKQIYQDASSGFFIERDWVLKTCLMLIDADVRFKVQNFKNDHVNRIQQEWPLIKNCIVQTFILIRRFGINPQSLTSKNAVIPVCYYLYKRHFENQPLYTQINNLAKVGQQRAKISQWFYMALIKGIFGGHSDSLLSSMRDVLKENFTSNEFPIEAIIYRYKGTNKDLRFDDTYINRILSLQYGEGRCRALLHLLFPEMDPSRVYHIDHLHPKSAFEKSKLVENKFLQDNQELKDFYIDPGHWNSIVNLHLLNDSQNLSKGDRSLIDWVNDPNIHISPEEMLIDEACLEFENFKTFYESRRKNLHERLKTRIFMTETVPPDIIKSDSDEEIVEEEFL